jgi:hypothetical protein
MMTNILRFVGSILLVTLFTACPETYVTDNFGASAVSLKNTDWDGQWHPADEPKEDFTFRVRDASHGILELQETTTKDPKKKPEIFTLSLRETGTKSEEKLYFAILKDTTKTDDGTLHLIRPAQENVFILWAIDSDAVTAALKSGELQGTIVPDKDGPHNKLAADPKNYPQLLAPKFWKWTEPIVMLRSK